MMLDDTENNFNTLEGSPSLNESNSSLEGTRANATLHARRVANRLSLGPYGRELGTVLLYAGLLAVEQRVSNIAIFHKFICCQ
jgi:hypothetical protein